MGIMNTSRCEELELMSSPDWKQGHWVQWHGLAGKNYTIIALRDYDQEKEKKALRCKLATPTHRLEDKTNAMRARLLSAFRRENKHVA